MRVFIDSSTLFKKYAAEPGSEAFEIVLSKTTEIAVSPITWLEMNAATARRLADRSLSAEQARQLRSELKRDFVYFLRILWNDNLEAKAEELIHEHGLKTLDAVQLASGVLSEAELFITSDRKLFREAKKVLRHVVCV